MDISVIAGLLGLVGFSAVYTAIVVAALGRRHKAEIEALKKTPPLSVSAQELLHDLLRGSALVRIERISPADVLLRSPKT